MGACFSECVRQRITAHSNAVGDNPNRLFFVQVESARVLRESGIGCCGWKWCHCWSTETSFYKIHLRFQRYDWTVERRHRQFQALDASLRSRFPNEMSKIERLTNFNKCCVDHRDPEFVRERGRCLANYLQAILDVPVMSKCAVVESFLEISKSSFNPTFGRKFKEGFLRKTSGGYVAGFSRQYGDYCTHRRWRWISLHEHAIVWYRNEKETVPLGYLVVTPDFRVNLLQATVRRSVIILSNATRVVQLRANSHLEFSLWKEHLEALYGKYIVQPPPPRQFYSQAPPVQASATANDGSSTANGYSSSFPVRLSTDVKVYTYSKDYFAAAALAMLGAKKEILIASWKNTPRVLLTRPPHPPIRLDQILAYKAAQGVKIYVLLYKEVEIGGQGNDSSKASKYLEGLGATSRNIQVIRHPNKFIGGSTAIMWSHHEKLVVVDRNLAFVGGIDLAVGRWDDEEHSMVDEDALKFPGKDFRQPAEGLFKAARSANGQGAAPPVVDVNAAAPAPVPSPSDGQAPSPQTSAIAAAEVSVESSSDSEAQAAKASPSPSLTLAARPTSTLVGAAAGGGSEKFDVRTMYEVEEAGTDESYLDVFYDVGKQGLTSIWDTVTTGYEAMTALPGGGPRRQKEEGLESFQQRDLYPRSGWHDMHSSISGPAARDVASHFVQRWNHHRLAAYYVNTDILGEMTGSTSFGSCARCQYSPIGETDTRCLSCGHDLGPVSPYLQPIDPALVPPHASSMTFITFEFSPHLPLRCTPAPPSSPSPSSSSSPRGEEDGLASKANGDEPAAMTNRTSSFLPPFVTLAISSAQSNSVENDLCFKIRGSCPCVVVASSNNEPRNDQPNKSSLLSSQGTDRNIDALVAIGLAPIEGDVLVSVNDQVVTHLDEDDLMRFIGRKREQQKAHGGDVYPLVFVFRRHGSATMTSPAAATTTSTTTSTERRESESTHNPLAAVTKWNEACRHSAFVTDWGNTPAAAFAISSNKLASAATSSSSSSSRIDNNKNSSSNSVFCYAASRELAMSISLLFHGMADYKEESLPAKNRSNAGTCHVQVLRSTSTWSSGANMIECSIMNAWVDAILRSQHFVYVENQFFIGNTTNKDRSAEIKNGVPAAILDRIVRAARQNERFKCFIVIPQHPNGDIAFVNKPRIILHYQCETINKGLTSMIEKFKRVLPDVDPYQYISFFCLQNYGVINNQFVHDQIYVHDKMLICDDRVLIIGSANINDRSMIGDRDSEVAIRIEDTSHTSIPFGGHQHFAVGLTPHTIRMRLMRQHIGDSHADVVDPVTSQLFQQVADSNSALYDAVDDDTSVYRCTNLMQYRTALVAFKNKSIDAIEVRNAMSGIRGTLVNWPMNFLHEEEHLGPDFATRTIVPTDLWV